jgi:hypothetical protein
MLNALVLFLAVVVSSQGKRTAALEMGGVSRNVPPPNAAANGFANYIASGGGRDFMRPITQEVYRIPRERVIGSASTFEYASNETGGAITHKAEADYLDDGPQKPIRIWSRTGRRPLAAAGNSNGDVPMLQFTKHDDKTSLRLLVLHDDAEREFDYVSGAEQALEQAGKDGWTVVSIKNDWATVF